ncbi:MULTISPECIES: septum site-determining protein MinC [unclassified Butyrivibrio]|uniref:septum site-determining protein MinC n=1 Tax=unclassified Butyrivibrio TaxID=2639466 RepID=UPI00041AAE25|nr:MULTISPECIES: septum site-determining protein MinC [unclassified Butyrivibrio]SEK43109.1 septum site-determining protein MinC [Butyrivibrio sp. ob235]
MGAVNLKGTGKGIILELDPKESFEILVKEIADKFRESKSFLGKASMGMIIRGRTLCDKEENEILDTISNNCDIDVCCVIRDDPDTDRIFASYVKQPVIVQQEEDSKPDEEQLGIDPDIIKKQADIHTGNLRSGQDLSFVKSVVILGDVKPGASVSSEGNIFVMGALRGSAHAGSTGDESAFIMALELDPLQVRIADKIAISPDSDEGPRLKMKSFMKGQTDKKTEVAYILNGHIVKDVYGAAFLRDNRFI